MNRIRPQTTHINPEYLAVAGQVHVDVEPIESIEEPKNPIIVQLEQEIETLKSQLEMLKMQLESSRQEVMRLQMILHQGNFIAIGAYE